MQKNGIVSIIKMIPEEQDTQITYYLGQDLAEHKMTFEEYEENINKITKQDIINFATKVSIDTIYFLKN